MLRKARPVAATPSRAPNGIHQKTRTEKKLMPKEATASPRTGAGSSWTSIMADSGPFIPINSVARAADLSGKPRADAVVVGRRRGWPEDRGVYGCKDRRAWTYCGNRNRHTARW